MPDLKRKQRFPWHPLFVRGCIVYESSHNRGSLPKIIVLQPIVRVHIGVVSAGFEIERVLLRTDDGQARADERSLIRSKADAASD
jgi:hypothetical protein